MAFEGILANAAVTAVAGFAHLVVAGAILDRKTGGERRALVVVCFYALVGVHLLLASLRQAVSFMSIEWPHLAPLEAAVFYVSAVPAALAVLPLVYIGTFATSGDEQASRVVTGALATIISLGVFLLMWGGIEGPVMSEWGSEWIITSFGARAMLFLFVTLPMLLASALLIRVSRQLDGEARRRVGLAGLSFLVYSFAFTLDALGLTGVALLAARIVMGSAAMLGYAAYFRTESSAPVDGAVPTD